MPASTPATKVSAEDRNNPVIRVAICGEVNSGKSTVINSLMRRSVLPHNIGQERRPVIFAAYGAEPGVEFQSGGEFVRLGPDFEPEAIQDAENLQLWYDDERLQGFEFVEVPLTTAEDLTDEQISLIKSADVIIWVTIGSQAWRLTEKTILDQLGKSRPRQGILAVSRADKLRTSKDRARLKERMEREVAGYLQDVVFINGSRRLIEKAGASEEEWTKTGALEMIAALGAAAKRVQEQPPEEDEDDTVVDVDFEGATTVQEGEPEETAEVLTFSSRAAKEHAEVPAKPEPVEAQPEVEPEPVSEATADPEPAPVPAPKPKPAAPVDRGPEPEEPYDRVRWILADYSGDIFSGLYPEDAPLRCELFKGDGPDVRDVGRIIKKLNRRMANSFAKWEFEEYLDASTLQTATKSLFFIDIEDVGVFFFYSDVKDLSHPVAQSIVARCVRVLEELA